jgi:HK97 family phage portal protein
MKILSSISHLFRGQPAPETKSLDSLAMALRDSGSAVSNLSMHSAHQQSSWIYACTQALGEGVANIPFRFSAGQRRGEDLIESGDMVDLFNNPHPLITRFDFWEMLMQWLMLRGQAFIVGLTDSGEVINWQFRGGSAPKPTQLLILNPDRMRRDVRGGRLVGWYYTASGISEPMEGQYLLASEVIYHRLPLPGAFFDGCPPLSIAMMAASTDYYSAAFMRGLMANNADTGLVVSTDQKLSPEQRAALETAIRARKRQAGRADKPLILEGGLKVEDPTISAADMQFLENRKFNRQEICAIFRVPQEIIGFSEDANRSVSQSARLNFVENRLLPMAERIEARMEGPIHLWGDDVYGWFDSDALPIMQEAKRARADVALKYWSMGVPFNDINQSLELGFPSYPWHKKGYMPFSVQPVESSTAPAEPEDTTEELEDDTDADPAAAAAEKALRLITQSDPQPVSPPVHSCAGPSSQAFAAATQGSVRLKKGKLQRFFFEQRSRVIASLADAVKRIEAQKAEATKPQAINIHVDAAAKPAPRTVEFERNAAGDIVRAKLNPS